MFENFQVSEDLVHGLCFQIFVNSWKKRSIFCWHFLQYKSIYVAVVHFLLTVFIADSVLGERNEITNEDLNNLTYVSSVIKETLRLRPVVNTPFREINTNDFKINGIHIPKGAMLHVNIFDFKILKNKYYLLGNHLH